MNSNQRFRARFILACMLIAACGLAVSLYVTQIMKGSEYAAKAQAQYSRPRITSFDRGTIFFASKGGSKPAAATLTTRHLLSMNPKLVTDISGTYKALSHYVDLDEAQFAQKAGLKDDPYEELADNMDATVAQSIQALALPGISVTKENKRAYPGDRLASQTLGLIGEDKGEVKGRYGLERSYESVLARKGSSGGSSFFAQLFSDEDEGAQAAESDDNDTPGDIVTTIEPTVQAYLEKILAQTSKQWAPDEIGGIIMDPHTGEIVAMASLPDFDPNDTSKVKDPAVFSNPLVEHAYEMGSIMKPLTVATGLDTGAIKPTTTYDDTGTMTLSGKKISNFDGKARGIVPIQEILSQSLNVGAATVALKVGKDDFSRYFSSFGFGTKTGIDQPNETPGLTSNLKTGRDIEIATMAYGQGIALSPIAITRALSVLANNGALVRPHLVQEIDYIDGTKKEIEVPAGTQVLKPESVAQTTKMLVKVVDEALRKGALKMDHYSIAAKTGTAQIPDPATKGYFSDRYLHSFFGYFPAYEPKFIVFLYQKHPKGAQYASETLAEPFSELAKFLINYYSVPPDR